MNGICLNMGLVEVAENTVGLLELMAEEYVRDSKACWGLVEYL